VVKNFQRQDSRPNPRPINAAGTPLPRRDTPGSGWSDDLDPTIDDSITTDGTGTGSFSSLITGLTANTVCFVRAYATNKVGTAYGDTKWFTTVASTVTGIDGNVYQTVTIGDQVWTAANLKVTHYRNGDPIPNVTSNTAWAGLTTGAYCNYSNDAGYGAVYGRLYNWHSAMDSRNIALEGWHVASDAEWQTLVNYLGWWSVAGGKLKQTGTTYWVAPNTGATNETGFSGLPGGYRHIDGSWCCRGYTAYFMSATGSTAYYRTLERNDAFIRRFNESNNQSGFSVRCVKD